MRIEKFKELATEAKSGYREMLVAIAKGDDVSPEDAQHTAQLAGRSMIDLAADLEIATRRYDASQAFESRDWSVEIAAAVAASRTAAAARETADAEFEAVVQKRRHAHAAADAASARVNQLTTERDTAQRDLATLLRSTGNDSQPESFRLHDEPAPANDWGDRVIDVGAKTNPADIEAARKAEADRRAEAAKRAAECDYGDADHVVTSPLVSTAGVVL